MKEPFQRFCRSHSHWAVSENMGNLAIFVEYGLSSLKSEFSSDIGSALLNGKDIKS
jgi:hypothetical protein